MTILFKILFSFIAVVPLMHRKYQRHKQVCSALNTVDRRWELLINEDQSFVYQIRTINTKESKKKVEKTILGSWETNGDTLKLIERKANTLPVCFLLKGERLLAINAKADTLSNFIIQLDYLEKAKRK